MDKVLRDCILNKYEEVSKEFGIDSGILTRDFYRHYHLLKLIKKYTPNNNEKILDISAGFAIPSRILKDEGFNIYATDSMSIAGAKICESSNKIFSFTNIENLEINSLPFEENSFEVVLWLATIEHIHNSPKRILEWIYRILKNNGIVIIDTPNILELRKRIMLLFGKSFMPPIQFIYNLPYHGDHHREYTKADLEYVIRQSGHQIVYSQIVDTISSISIDKRIKINERKGSQPEIEQMTKFKIGWNLLNFYDWIKLSYSILVKFVPSFRDTLFIIGKKNG